MNTSLDNESDHLSLEEEDLADYNVSTSVTITKNSKQDTTTTLNSIKNDNDNLDENSNASENNEESFELIKISSDSENVPDIAKNTTTSRSTQLQQQQQQQYSQQNQINDEEEEEEANEIQLREVSNWRKQNQTHEQDEQQEQQQQRQVPARTPNYNPNVYINNNEGDQLANSDDHQFNSENIPDDENLLRQKFQQFMEEKKQKCVLFLDEGRVNLLPAQLRHPIQNIINTVKRLTARNPTGAPLSALQILAERLDEFLELQEHRSDRDYEIRCRDLLSIIYRNTIEAQRLSRQLRDAAAPRSLDEYENY